MHSYGSATREVQLRSKETSADGTAIKTVPCDQRRASKREREEERERERVSQWARQRQMLQSG